MNTTQLRHELQDFLNAHPTHAPIEFRIQDSVTVEGYTRQYITYQADDGDMIPAYLLIPDGAENAPAVLLHHQHHGERHFGKSEVCGLAGDPLQAFAPQLAQMGFIVLAPDAICFEDRRPHASGIDEHEDDDWLYHFNEMSFRLTQGDTLMRKVLSDSAQGISLLASHPLVNATRIGTLGHSYGGNTVLFHAALDERIQFACSSGAACSYAYKFQNGIPLEAALTIPHFAATWDLHHLLLCTTPRHMLIVSADADKYSQDAPQIIDNAQAIAPLENLKHLRYQGTHPITPERFAAILEWFKLFA